MIDITSDDFSHLAEAFYETDDHDYQGDAIEVSLDVELSEVLDENFDIRSIFSDAYLTSQQERRKVEVVERRLSESEQAEFREAKLTEWHIFVDNQVVELVTSRRLDPGESLDPGGY
jgi:hypothetical protein